MSIASSRNQVRKRPFVWLKTRLQPFWLRLVRVWASSPDLPANLRMEQRFVAVRYLGILFLGPALPFLGLTPTRVVAAYMVALVATAYNIGVQALIRRRSNLLNLGYVTTIGDGLLDVAIVLIGGGFASPFYPILFTT